MICFKMPGDHRFSNSDHRECTAHVDAREIAAIKEDLSADNINGSVLVLKSGCLLQVTSPPAAVLRAMEAQL